MQTVHQAAVAGLVTLSSEPSTSGTLASPASSEASSSRARTPQALLDRFWLKMAHMFGNTWVRQYGVDPAGGAADTWSSALAGLTPEQIAIGLQGLLALGLEWPPAAPRFRAMCLGVPSMASVRHQMVHPGDEHSPFMRQFWSFLNTAEYQSGDEYRCERAVNEAYELTCEHVMRGKQLPPPISALLQRQKPTKPKAASEATARAALSDIARMLMVGEPDQQAVA